MQFSQELLALWGKKKADETNQFYWLPIMAHLIDTGNIIKYLYHNYLNDSQRDLLTTAITPNLVGFLGYVHDIGKITPAFQEKAARPVNLELDNLLSRHLIANHLNLPKLSFPEKTPHNLAGEVFLEKNHTLNLYFGALIGAHHGQPETKHEVQMQSLIYSENYGGDVWQKLRLEALNYSLAKLNANEIKTLKEVKLTQQQAILLTGLIIMADWLASNEHYFPLIKLTQNFNNLDMNQRFKTGISKWTKEDQWLPHNIKNFTSYFKQHFDFVPHPVQTQMLTDITSIKNPGLIIIEAPMGSGKTETALTASEILSAKKHKSGIFFALPTQATANAMFTRLEHWLNCEKGTQGLKLMHGHANLSHDYQELNNAKSDVIVNSWYSKKLGTLEPFSVGTIDQLLSMGLKQRHLFLKHLGFSGKTVIIDEIHAYDVYMQSYLEKVLMWLGSYNVPVIALSATLPFNKRQALVNAYLYSKHIKTKLENSTAYPLLTWTDSKTVKQDKDFVKSKSKTVNVKILNKAEPKDIAQKADNLVKTGGICGIIVNSIKRAQEIAKNIKATKILLHSAFLASDRTKLEEKLQNLIGKNGNRPEKLVVIGTQVLEQSLDIDFDVLISDLAPMDLLLQRIGRLQRHVIQRPDKCKSAVCYVIYNKNGASFKLDNYLYSNYIINQTLKYLPDKMVLPDDISTLVQKVYSGEENEGKEEFDSNMLKERQKAKVFQIAKPIFKPKSISNWLDMPSKDADKNEILMSAMVRDIKPQLEVILVFNNKDHDIGKLLKQTVKLPLSLNSNLQQTINVLTNKDWQNNKLLKHELCLKLDKNGKVNLNGYTVTYNKILGLITEKMVLNDCI